MYFQAGQPAAAGGYTGQTQAVAGYAGGYDQSTYQQAAGQAPAAPQGQYAQPAQGGNYSMARCTI